MGKGTEEADLAAETQNVSTTMVAGLVVRANDKVVFSKRTYYCVAGDGAFEHVERKLMCALTAMDKGLIQGAKGDVKITLYTHWSPCQSCLSELRQWALKTIDGLGHRTFLKVVFKKYYTAANHGGPASGKDYWPNDDAAIAAYAQTTQESGLVQVRKIGVLPGEDIPDLLFKHRPRVTIKRAYDKTASDKWAVVKGPVGGVAQAGAH